MKQIYLLGRGISHSFSPAMWNSVFDELGVDMRYGLCDVEESELPSILEDLKSSDVWAYNVTMPYKAWARGVATVTTPEVERSGVANFLSYQGGELVAANTDIEGARALLKGLSPPDVTLLLGAGATATALLVSLADRAERIVIANRTYEHAATLAEKAGDWGLEVTVVEWEQRVETVPQADLLVNTTPFGQSIEGSPLPDAATFRDGASLYDVIYGSEITPFQRQAAAAGLRVCDGLAHLEDQAVALLPHFGLDPAHADLVRRSLRDVVGRAPLRWDVPSEARS